MNGVCEVHTTRQDATELWIDTGKGSVEFMVHNQNFERMRGIHLTDALDLDDVEKNDGWVVDV